jgi:predicted RNA-binding Zn-ribbon protein involved in translation (DUF1610 family)
VPNSTLAETGQAKTIEVQQPSQTKWYVTYATGKRGGPFREDELRGMIARQELKITDSILAEGGTVWTPITQSPFAASIAHQAHMNRLASSTCPRCGSAMAIILRRSGASKACILGGILTCWVFGFGVIFIIIGLIIGRNPKPRYECPACKYKSK